MNAKNEYNKFLTLEKKGDYLNAWAALMYIMYQKDKDSEEIFHEIMKREWIDERLPYMNIDDNNWHLIFAALADDAENRQNGIICLLVCRILDRNYRWYGAISHLNTVKRLLDKYSDWSEYRNAMELKANQLGYML